MWMPHTHLLGCGRSDCVFDLMVCFPVCALRPAVALAIFHAHLHRQHKDDAKKPERFRDVVSSLAIEIAGVAEAVLAFIPVAIRAHDELKATHRDGVCRPGGELQQRLLSARKDKTRWPSVLRDLKRLLSCWRPDFGLCTHFPGRCPKRSKCCKRKPFSAWVQQAPPLLLQ